MKKERRTEEKILRYAFLVYYTGNLFLNLHSSESRLDSLRLLLVSRLVEQGEHVLLVRLDARLVERIDFQHIAADAAGFFEEVEELADVVLVDFREGNLEVGHTAIDVGELRAEFGHLVHLIDVLAGHEVEAVQVGVVGRNYDGVLGLFDGDNRLEDGAFAVLNPLAHRVQVGREIDGSGEDSLVVFTLALAVELFPPLGDVVQLRVEVAENLDLLARLVKFVARGSVDRGDVLGEGNALVRSLFHESGTGDELTDVIASDSDREQTHRREDGEAAADVVGDDEGLVALLVGERAESAFACVGDGDDALASLVLADGVFELLFQDTESDGRLGRRPRLGDVDDTELFAFQRFCQFIEIVLADVVAGIEEDGVLAILLQPVEAVVEGFDDGLRPEVAAADADSDNDFALVAEDFSGILDVRQVFVGDGRREVEPAEEVVASAIAVVEGCDTFVCFCLLRVDLFF